MNATRPYTDVVYDATAYPDEFYRRFKMSIYTSENIQTATNFIIGSSFVPEAKSYQITPNERKFREPSFMVAFSRQQEVEAFLDKLEAHKISPAGVELIHIGYWNIRDYDFDERDFPRPDEMITAVQARGHRFTVQLRPEYEPKHSAASEGLLLHYTNGSIKQGQSVNILDLTRVDGADLYSGLLRKLKHELGLQSFLAGSHSLAEMQLANSRPPSTYIQTYLETLYGVAGKNMTSWIAYKGQYLPMFIQLASHWSLSAQEVLKSIIPAVLAVSVGGYSYVAPPPIYFAPPTDTTDELSEELYIRWLQIVTLMPHIFFYCPGAIRWDYSNRTIELTRKFIQLHAAHADEMIKLIHYRYFDQHSIIRPLWYVEPDNPATYVISDQFLVGNDILVAPVVKLGARERSVYFLNGTWLDANGAEFHGPGEQLVAAPLEELPYFKRKME